MNRHVFVVHRALLYLSLALSFSGALARDAIPLEELMTQAEFEQMGLHKLSGEERERLGDWITSKNAELERVVEERLREPAPDPRDGIPAKVIPEFTGWSGKTVFTLDNGEIWKQRKPGRFTYSGNSNAVVLRKRHFGFWYLEHPESGEATGVTKVK